MHYISHFCVLIVTKDISLKRKVEAHIEEWHKKTKGLISCWKCLWAKDTEWAREHLLMHANAIMIMFVDIDIEGDDGTCLPLLTDATAINDFNGFQIGMKPKGSSETIADKMDVLIEKQEIFSALDSLLRQFNNRHCAYTIKIPEGKKCMTRLVTVNYEEGPQVSGGQSFVPELIFDPYHRTPIGRGWWPEAPAILVIGKGRYSRYGNTVSGWGYHNEKGNAILKRVDISFYVPA